MKFLLPLFLLISSISFSQMPESGHLPPVSNDTTVKDTIDPIFIKVETMPHYEECFNENSNLQNSCTQKKIIEHIGENFIVPETIKAHGIGGTIIVAFVVYPDGSIQEIEIVKGLHVIADNAAIETVKSIPPMIPGEQLGEKVKVRYVIPIRIQAETKKERKKKKKNKS